MFDVVLLFSLALVSGGAALVAPWAAVVVAGGIVALARRRVAAAACVCAGLAIGAARARSVVARFERHAAQVAAASPRPARCTASARVDGSPTWGHGVPRYQVALREVLCEDVPLPDTRAVLYGGPDDLARGDVLSVVAQLAAPDRFDNPELGAVGPPAARRAVTRTGAAIWVERRGRGAGATAFIDRARSVVRGRIMATFPHETAPMARALMLGESDLDPDDDAAFRASGLSHLLAVSGMHLVLVVVGVVRALGALLVRIERLASRLDVGRIAAATGVPLAWIYEDFAGGSGSARRAAWMLTASLLARALGRRPDARRAFALSLLMAAAVDPLAAFDVSLVLSAAATAGLLVVGRPMSDALVARAPTWAGGLARAIATTLAATVPCAPVLAAFAPTLPLGGVVANVVAVPLGELAALPLCLLHAALVRWPDAERGAALLASGALHLVRLVARASASAQFAQLPVVRPTSAQLAIAALAAAGWVMLKGRARASWLAAALASALLAEGLAIRFGAPRGNLRATFFDVGQGDAALVDLPDGSAMLIDAGGMVGSPVDLGARVIAPMLRARRRSELRLVVLSHHHPDHFGGLQTGLAGVRVAEAWDSGQGEREGVSGGYAAWLSSMRMQSARISRPDTICGARDLGGARVEVLAPCPQSLPERSPNDNSIVLRVTYGARSMLFVGDAEREAETDLLASGKSLASAVLKVGHHGSRTSSSPAFVAAVRPEVAVISCGVRNRFGHPTAEALSALGASGARVLRTDRVGAVTIETDGISLRVGTAVDVRALPFHSPLP